MDDLYDTFLKELGLPDLPTHGDVGPAMQRRHEWLDKVGPTRAKFFKWLEGQGFTVIEPVQTIRILS